MLIFNGKCYCCSGSFTNVLITSLLSSVLDRVFSLILKIRPSACPHLKKLCKLGLRPEFGLRSIRLIYLWNHPVYKMNRFQDKYSLLFACFLIPRGILFVCLSVCPFVCRLWNLLSHSLRGSIWRLSAAFRIVSDTFTKATYCESGWKWY